MPRTEQTIFHFHQKKRPYNMKWAESQDGFISPKVKESIGLSMCIQERRTSSCGNETVMITCGEWTGGNPVRSF
jgi:diaminohydroxyphosphoribosylaminopyrimidine deaminase/5-amino-6-(5-phosphoribosylamino)uracil reductase